MRTKTIERKRYSLRKSGNGTPNKQTVLKSEEEYDDVELDCEEVLSTTNKINSPAPKKQKIVNNLCSTTATVGEKDYLSEKVVHQECSSSITENKKTYSNQQVAAIKNVQTFRQIKRKPIEMENNQNKESYDTTKNKSVPNVTRVSSLGNLTKELDRCEAASRPDVLRYSDLEHAITCEVTPQCTHAKCITAKQFLIHCSACTDKTGECKICKAMGILVCNHAQVCNVPLEKCCPIPNCDKVRLMVLEEWVRLKHKHNEMMQRVFRGLIHAKKCREKNCDLLLCQNVKTIIYHTHKCTEKDCKTKKFIVQLCEHHQRICLNEQCDVEFCQENTKIRKEKENLKRFAQSTCSVPPSLSTPNVECLPNFVPWQPSFGPSQVPVYPQYNTVPPQIDPATVYGNDIAAIDIQDTRPIHELPNSQEDCTLSKGNEQAINHLSPTEEMYYQLWQNKEEINRNVLPRLSPNDLQNILMTRTDDAQQFLSPVTDNRVKYSEIQTYHHQDANSRSSQESELEENPLPSTQYENILKPMPNNQVQHQDSYYAASSSYQQDIRRKQLHASTELKNQNEWANMDFIKQQMERHDIETVENVDEGDSVDARLQQNITSFQQQARDLTSLEKTYISSIRDTNFF